MALLTGITISKIGSHTLPTPKEIMTDTDNLRWLERDVINTSTRGIMRERTDNVWTEYILDAPFVTAVAGVQALAAGVFARVSITHIDKIAKSRTTPAAINLRLCKISEKGTGSLIEYMNESGLQDKILTVLESPDAIAAGNSSTTGS